MWKRISFSGRTFSIADLRSTQVIIVQHGSMGYYVPTLVSLDAFVSPLNSVLSCTLLSGEGPGKARVHICSNTWFVDVDDDVCLSILFFFLLIHFLKVWRRRIPLNLTWRTGHPQRAEIWISLGAVGQFRELTWVGCCSGLDSCFSFHSCYATALSNLKASKVQTKAIFKMLS